MWKLQNGRLKEGTFFRISVLCLLYFPEVTFQDNISGKIVILCYPCSFSNAAWEVNGIVQVMPNCLVSAVCSTVILLKCSSSKEAWPHPSVPTMDFIKINRLLRQQLPYQKSNLQMYTITSENELYVKENYKKKKGQFWLCWECQLPSDTF